MRRGGAALILALVACAGAKSPSSDTARAARAGDTTDVPARSAAVAPTGATRQTTSAATKDTLAGRVVQVGPDPVAWMALTLANGKQLRLSGKDVAALTGVAGARIWVSGKRSANGFTVDAFEVRNVNDQPVDDGTVVVTSNGVALRTRAGTQRDVPNAPPSMRELAGARIWVTRPVAGVAPSFGLISR